MIKLHLASDLHIDTYDFDSNEHIGHWGNFDIVCLAGDIANDIGLTTWLLTKAAISFPNTTILFVAGNHDFYFTSKDELFRELANIEDKHPNFVHLRVGNIFTEDGVAFIGDTLWTDFKFYEENTNVSPQESDYYLFKAHERMSDYKCILNKELPTKELKRSFEDYVHSPYGDKATLARRFLAENKLDYRFTPLEVQREHYKQRAWILQEATRLKAQGYKIVVMTHHLPHEDSLDNRYAYYMLDHCYASCILGKEKLPIDYWFHGHSHSPSDYEVLGTRVIAEPTGYREPQRRNLMFSLEI